MVAVRNEYARATDWPPILGALKEVAAMPGGFGRAGT
jgi:hypothetical protein